MLLRLSLRNKYKNELKRKKFISQRMGKNYHSGCDEIWSTSVF